MASSSASSIPDISATSLKKITLSIRKLKFSSVEKYTCTPGKQKIYNSWLEKSPRFHKSSSFYGHCYHCGYGKHSQNFCPVKLCDLCNKYGHDARVCYFRKKMHPTQHTHHCHHNQNHNHNHSHTTRTHRHSSCRPSERLNWRKTPEQANTDKAVRSTQNACTFSSA